MTRRQIRDHKFKILFSLIINNEDVDVVVDRYFENLPIEEDNDNSYVKSSQKKYKNVNFNENNETITSDTEDNSIEENESKNNIFINENDIQEIKDFVKAVISKKDELDEKVSKALTGWDFKRIPNAELTILRICLYEIYYTDLDTAVSINEAVLLSKIYGMTDKKSNKFINAVLSTIVKGNG